MYRIERKANRVTPLVRKTFGQLNFRERDHLQEWIANDPTILGSDLLIIQKEFNGFDDTRERIDLLALDTEGRLVIIENKLDDSGKDVVWQALKYASYCWDFTKQQIISVFQEYLDQTKDDRKAEDVINDFLPDASLEEVTLNQGNGQRVILVAANFRKEVTTAALWLLSHGVRLQCFQANPYSLGEEMFLDVKQIIPVPETQDFVIKMGEKESEERRTDDARRDGKNLRKDYWTYALDALRERNVTLYQNISPGSDHWAGAGSGVPYCPFNLIFLKKSARVELYISRANKDENKKIFDYLFARRSEVEAIYQGPLDWMRLDDKTSSRIAASADFMGYDRGEWPKIVDWHAKHIVRLESAISGPLHEAVNNLSRD